MIIASIDSLYIYNSLVVAMIVKAVVLCGLDCLQYCF